MDEVASSGGSIVLRETGDIKRLDEMAASSGRLVQVEKDEFWRLKPGERENLLNGKWIVAPGAELVVENGQAAS